MERGTNKTKPKCATPVEAAVLRKVYNALAYSKVRRRVHCRFSCSNRTFSFCPQTSSVLARRRAS